ncbi:anthranilate phosphoribosyltransferase [Desulfacinum hydrothermale DSM 13146]|uniref:Anthranilate phosphoribosyltransferase n=1 Tax=Desulfacinum hydrothermale DSM 13146 TaxID=1121390 RepID=A0A1W1XSE6_9BACT|nr:anthranilate phosphoribosyltransferase [Desulfacinum hydrothermale]SMC26784.1 anthranilate phosphoribosyltransferase [Desulfacinum hydrothermale DSM 13146]
MFQESLQKITSGTDLSEEQMSSVMDALMSGELTEAQIGALMAALATKGETFGELAGAARTMRRKAHRLQVSSPTVVDTCGTGGDGAQTFNISTTAAFVVAGCGVTVAKHGNRSVSSRCGSADVLEALGVRLDVDPEIVEEGIGRIGIGFLFAPLYHGAMKYAAKPRKEVGIRSIFNMLGPLTNPAGANCQVLGVYAPQLTEMFAQALKLLGARRAFVVHGHDGLDEITVCAPTRVTELNDGLVRTYELDPEMILGRTADPDALQGGSAEDNAEILRNILAGEKGPRRDVVVLNAAAALVAAGAADHLHQGVTKAQEAIDTGAAQAKLEALVRFTQENAP